MIDWLLRPAPEELTVEAGGRLLPLSIRRLPNSRRISLRLAPGGNEVRISMPRWGRTDEAIEFARAKADWIAAQLQRIPDPVELAPGTLLPYRGEQLVLRHQTGAPRRPVLDDGELVLGGPPENLQPRLRRWFESEARRLLADDLDHYCARANQPQQRLMLSSAQRRWGSCARDGTIRVNWRLIMAPDAVRRSVVAHEVAHLVHFDHSPAFHAALAELFEGEIAAANRWLKRDGRSLYTLFG